MVKKLNKKITPGKSRSTTRGKELDISMKAIVDNIAFSKDERWAFYQVRNFAYDYLTFEDRGALAYNLNKAIAGIMAERREPLDMYVIADQVPLDITAWFEQNFDAAKNYVKPEGYNDYMLRSTNYLARQAFANKVVFIGVKLSNRRSAGLEDLNILESGLRGTIDTLYAGLSSLMKTPEMEVSRNEEELARSRESSFFNNLSTSSLQARRCTAEEILLLLKRTFYPAMTVPSLDIDQEERYGASDIAIETSHSIVKRPRWLEISQVIDEEIVTGYRACLTFSKFPKLTSYPESSPFFYLIDSLPFSTYARFTFFPSSKMKGEIEKKEKEHKDELKNLDAAQDDYDAAINGLPPEVAEALSDQKDIKQILAQDKSPWVEGSYHVIVEAPTEEVLRKYCAIVKHQYNNADIVISWSVGDQVKLFLEQMPGDHVRVDSYDQTTTCSHIADSGIFYSSEVGDSIKPRDRKKNKG